MSPLNHSETLITYAPAEVEVSIERLIPVLRRYTAEEIDAVRERLESLLERRQVPLEYGSAGSE